MTRIVILAIGVLTIFGRFLLNATPANATATPCAVPTSFATIASALADPGCTEITLTAGTFNESGLTINRNVTITGIGSSDTIINAGFNDRAFTIESTATTTLRDLAIHFGNSDELDAFQRRRRLPLQRRRSDIGACSALLLHCRQKRRRNLQRHDLFRQIDHHRQHPRHQHSQ